VSDVLSTNERVQRLEDQLEIQKLVNVYGRLLDQRDFEAFAKLFADDGEILLGPLARATGPAEIQRAMEAGVPGPRGEDLHIIGTPTIELDGDTAKSEVMWTVIRRGNQDSPVVSMVGRHRDDLVRERGQWRIKRRRGFVDIPSALASREGES
jgi:3-phenylpropionate/cinnamic acid dioxygenase small subunit